MLEVEIVKALFDKEEFDKYSPYVTKNIIVDGEYKLSDEVWNIYSRLKKYYEKNEDKINPNDLEKIMLAEREGTTEAAQELLKDAFKDVSMSTPTQPTEEMLKSLKERAIRWEAMDLISDGDSESAMRLLKSIDEIEKDEIPSINMSITETHDEAEAANRWKWWCPTLDSLLEGFGDERGLLLMARPNAGKTSCLCNMSVNFARQGAKVMHVVIAEDTRVKLRNRYYSVAYDVDDEELSKNIEFYNDKFVDEFGKGGNTEDSSIYVLPYPTMTLLQLRKAVEQIRPDVVILDPITKVILSGKKELRGDEALAKIGQDLEAMSMEFNFGFICVIQAGADAETKLKDGTKKPKKWLDMSDVFNSNTAVQGEFQSILGLGSDSTGAFLVKKDNVDGYYEAENRYLNVCKSKSKGGRVSVIFNPMTGVIREPQTVKEE